MLKTFMKRPIFQYAWGVNDLDAACRRWIDAFGAGPFFTARHHKAGGYYRYRGDPRECDLSYAFGYCGPVMIQLIELRDDTPSIFSDMYPRGTEGFHHVAILGHDYPKDRQHILDHFAIWQKAHDDWDGGTDPIRDAIPLERQDA